MWAEKGESAKQLLRDKRESLPKPAGQPERVDDAFELRHPPSIRPLPQPQLVVSYRSWNSILPSPKKHGLRWCLRYPLNYRDLQEITYAKVKKVWMYLYRAVDSQGDSMKQVAFIASLFGVAV
jgi:hypothetical protein